MKKYIAIVCGALALSACNRNEDLLPDNLTGVNKAIDRYEEILNASNGKPWLLVNYPDKDLSYGGYSFVLKFTNGEVEAHSDWHPEGVKSMFSVIASEGPTLSFDESNKVLYALTTPSSEYPSGYKGDVDFIIEKYEDGIFYLHGRKSGNKMVLRPFEGDIDSYFAKITRLKELLKYTAFSPLSIGGKEVSFEFLTDTRHIRWTVDGKQEQTPYNYTDSGVEFRDPFEIAGVKLSGATLSADETTLTFGSGLTSQRFDLDESIDLNKLVRVTYAAPGYMCQELLDLFASVHQAESRRTSKTYYGNFTTSRLVDVGLQTSARSPFSTKRLGGAPYPAFGFKELLVPNASAGYYDSYALSHVLFLPVYGHRDQISVRVDGVGAGWSFFVYTLNPLMQSILSHAPYKAEVGERGDIKLMSVADENYWFLVTSERYPGFAVNKGTYRGYIQTGYVSDNIVTLFQDNKTVTRGSTSYEVQMTFRLGRLGDDGGVLRLWTHTVSTTTATKVLEYYYHFVPVPGTTDRWSFVPRDGAKPAWSTTRYPFAAQFVQLLQDKSPFEIVKGDGDSYWITSEVDANFWIYVAKS